MLTKKNASTPISFAIAVLMMLALTACGSNPPIQSQPASTQSQGQNEPTKSPKKAKTPVPAKTLSSTETPLPANTPEPSTIPAPAAPGLSRNNPYPRSTTINAPNWNIQVLEIKRGDSACQDI